MEPRKNLPSILLIGAPKCGTTSLAHMLNDSRQISFGLRKEPGIFLSNDPVSSAINNYGGNSAEHFLDASTAYMKRPKFSDVAKKVQTTYNVYSLPMPKIIACVRDPVERIQSHINFDIWRQNISTPKNLKEKHNLFNARPKYINYSRYSYQLDQWIKVFPDQLLVLDQKSLKNRQQEVVDRVAEFIGVMSFAPRSYHSHVTSAMPPVWAVKLVQKYSFFEWTKDHCPVAIREKAKNFHRRTASIDIKRSDIPEEILENLYSEYNDVFTQEGVVTLERSKNESENDKANKVKP